MRLLLILRPSEGRWLTVRARARARVRVRVRVGVRVRVRVRVSIIGGVISGIIVKCDCCLYSGQVKVGG